jgi:hypothetical protein
MQNIRRIVYGAEAHNTGSYSLKKDGLLPILRIGEDRQEEIRKERSFAIF